MRPAKDPKNPTEEEIRDAMRRSKGSLAIEGMHVTPEEEQLVYDRLANHITEEEFIKRASS